jgi:hypothetical protein
MEFDNPKKTYGIAVKNYNLKFAQFALEDTVEFVESINGFNLITKPLWNRVLKVKV